MLTNNILKSALIAAAMVAGGAAQAAPYTDTVESPTSFFVPTDAQKYDQPFYRGNTQDWDFTHGAIAGTITSATLNISAFDVDFSSGEIDNIYAWDDGVAVLLGSLAGGSDIYSFTVFTLGANFYNDIAAGLKITVDIDATNAGWLLTLAKSSLSIDGGSLPPPTPGGAVPEPATWAMMIGGFAMIGASMRRRKAAVSFA